MKAFTESFSILDPKGTGQISTKSLQVFIASMGQVDPTLAEVQELVDKVDVEKKGGINFPQFLQLMDMNKGNEAQEALAAFNLFETDNAPITAEKMHVICQKLGQDITVEEVKSMITTIAGKEALDFGTFKKMMMGQL